MEIVCQKDKCTGCSACVDKCPVDCINMVPDECGHLHSEIDHDRCIDCGACEKVCPSNYTPEFHSLDIAYASWILDKNERETSTSGGLGAALANYILNEGGVVYGASIVDGYKVQHIRVTQKDDLKKLKGSKYVQSYIRKGTFKDIRDDLHNGKNVLFIGTPCQVAGVKKYIGDDANLFLVDIICHGVPSQQILLDHLRNKTSLDNINYLTFRGKEYGLTLTMHNGKVLKYPFPKDRYLVGFMYGLFYRDSCYQCLYAKAQRVSDITIGDFWGLGDVNYSKEKVSVCLPNTNKGKRLLFEIRNLLFIDERSRHEAVSGNDQLQRPSYKNKYFKVFKFLYPKIGFKTASNISLFHFYIKHEIYKLLMNFEIFRKYYIGKKTKSKI